MRHELPAFATRRRRRRHSRWARFFSPRIFPPSCLSSCVPPGCSGRREERVLSLVWGVREGHQLWWARTCEGPGAAIVGGRPQAARDRREQTAFRRESGAELQLCGRSAAGNVNVAIAASKGRKKPLVLGSAWEGETFRWPLAAVALQIAPRRYRIEIQLAARPLPRPSSRVAVLSCPLAASAPCSTPQPAIRCEHSLISAMGLASSHSPAASAPPVGAAATVELSRVAVMPSLLLLCTARLAHHHDGLEAGGQLGSAAPAHPVCAALAAAAQVRRSVIGTALLPAWHVGACSLWHIPCRTCVRSL